MKNVLTKEELIEEEDKYLPPLPFEFDESKMIKVSVKGWIRLAQYAGSEMILSKKGTAGYKEFSQSDSEFSFKDKAKSKWNYGDWKSFHVGILGEIAYALETGLNPNVELLSFGDGNEDFKDIDVKATWTNRFKNTTDATLIESCYKKEKGQITKYYVKANLDINSEEVILVGWCTGEELCESKIMNFGKGINKYGDDGNRYVKHYSELNPIYTLPPFIKAKFLQVEKLNDFNNNMMKQVYKNNI